MARGLKKGQTNNPKGRPKGALNFVDEIRNDPRVIEIWGKLFNIALTLDTDKEHKDAMAATKIVADKTVPTLKAQEIEMSSETLKNLGVIVLPSKKPVGAPVNTKKSDE